MENKTATGNQQGKKENPTFLKSIKRDATAMGKQELASHLMFLVKKAQTPDTKQEILQTMTELGKRHGLVVHDPRAFFQDLKDTREPFLVPGRDCC